ncbi:uncharacterized protein LOC127865174 isoform X2 [Dreissena polymorpha]|nr:uncharacterized protein LOC127865174 isoform X2 [Dreissena polymorpha]
MSVEAVRMGRIPKVEKEKALEVFKQEGSDFNKIELSVEQTGSGCYDFKFNPKHGEKSSERCTDASPVDPNLVKANLTYFDSNGETSEKMVAPNGKDDNFETKKDHGPKFNSTGDHDSSGHFVSEVKHDAIAKVTSEESAHLHAIAKVTSEESAHLHAYNMAHEKASPIAHTPLNHSNFETTEHNLNTPKRYISSVASMKSKHLIAERWKSEQESITAKTEFDKCVVSYSQPLSKILNRSVSFGAVSFPPSSQQLDTLHYESDHSNPITLSDPEVCLPLDLTNACEHKGSRNSTGFNNFVTDSSRSPSISHKSSSYTLPEVQFNDSGVLTTSKFCGQLGMKVHPGDFTPTRTINTSPHYHRSTEGTESESAADDKVLFGPSEFPSKCGLMVEEESMPGTGRCSPSPSCFSRGSGGSGSSKSSIYSPILIKLLIEQVMETGGTEIFERLRKRLELSNMDSETCYRIISLLKEASGRTISDANSESSEVFHSTCSTISENKKERLAKFLEDVSCTFNVSANFGISHKRRFSECSLFESFENLDVYKHDKEKHESRKSFSSGIHPSEKIGSPKLHRQNHNNKISVLIGGNTSDDIADDVEDPFVEKMTTLYNGLNLGQKILFRLKPEHREKMRLFRMGMLKLRVMTDSDEDVKLVYEKLINGIPDLSQRVLGFCESVPGFSSFSKHDQDKLMKRAYYDLWTLSYAEYFQNGKSYWILPTGEIYSAPAMRKILNDRIVDTVMTFSDQFNALNLTDLEIAILCAIRLTASETEVLLDKPAIDALHSDLLQLLSWEVQKYHMEAHDYVLAAIARLMPLVDEINCIQKEIIGKFSTQFPKQTECSRDN